MRETRRAVLILALALLASACTTQVAVNPATAVGPQLSVERFLQAANTRDLDSMGRLFGTEDGPLGDTGSTFGCFFKKIGSWFGASSCQSRQEIELRMDAIAEILSHEDYQIGGQQMVAGRNSPTTRLMVDLTVRGEQVTDIPFVVVQASQGRWLVEFVDLQRVMARQQ